MLAAVGAGAYSDVWSASGALQNPAAEEIEPSVDSATRDAYGQTYKAYTTLYSALQETFSLLSARP